LEAASPRAYPAFSLKVSIGVTVMTGSRWLQGYIL
jgi:hypothetical protein